MSELDLENEETKSQVDAIVAKALEDAKGLHDRELQTANEAVTATAAKNTELLAEKKKISGDYSTLLGDKDPTYVRALLDQIENDEFTKMVAEGHIDEAFKKKTETLTSGYEGKLQNAEDQALKYQATIADYDQKFKGLMIDDQIKSAFLSMKDTHPTGLEDAIYRARSVFDLDDGGNVIGRVNGQILTGKDGVLSPSEWCNEDLRQQAPHLFVQKVGAGGSGGSGVGVSNKSWTDMNFEQQSRIMDADPAEANRLMLAATQA